MSRLRRDRPDDDGPAFRVPEGGIEDLKKVAPKLGFSGYPPLIRADVGQGLRKDLARLERDSAEALAASLRRRGVADEVIQRAVAEAGLESAVAVQVLQPFLSGEPTSEQQGMWVTRIG